MRTDFLSVSLANSAYFEGVGSFWTISHLKAYTVAFAQLIERCSNNFVRMEKEIFFLAFDLDKTETFVCEPSYSAFLHNCGVWND